MRISTEHAVLVSNRLLPGYRMATAETSRGSLESRVILDPEGHPIGEIHYRQIRRPGRGTEYGWSLTPGSTVLRTLTECAQILVQRLGSN